MIYDKAIEGKFVTLKSITLDDAEFSYNLRKDPRFVDIMGQPAKTLEDQKKFIEWQMKQPGDYYFVVFNKAGDKIGLIGIYNIEGDTGEAGREINIGKPNESIETQVLLTDFCIDVLGLKNRKAVVYKSNQKNINLLKHFKCLPKCETVRSGIPSYEYEQTFEFLRQSQKRARKLLAEISL